MECLGHDMPACPAESEIGTSFQGERRTPNLIHLAYPNQGNISHGTQREVWKVIIFESAGPGMGFVSQGGVDSNLQGNFWRIIVKVKKIVLFSYLGSRMKSMAT